MKAVGGPRSSKQSDLGKRTYTGFNDRYDLNPTTTRNKRTVWEVCTIGFPGAHFATYPPELIRPCILAGCPVGGTVLDFCAGSGTTGAVAYEEGRNFVGFDLNADYLDLAKIRIGNVQPKLFDLMDAADPEPAQ
jgi:DNA modification methylase